MVECIGVSFESTLRHTMGVGVSPEISITKPARGPLDMSRLLEAYFEQSPTLWVKMVQVTVQLQRRAVFVLLMRR
jgi:hypothetical protein